MLFRSTIQFGGISAFHTRISDPVVGGTYMTVSQRCPGVVIFLTIFFLAPGDLHKPWRDMATVVRAER